jgi:hypothetical protein
LPQKQQRHLLRGKVAFLSSLEEIAEKAGIQKQQFKWIYPLLSSYVHGLPMSFYRMHEQNRSRGVQSEAEENYTSLFLSLASSMLVKSRDELHTLFKDLKK